jgi:hypothetical protein
VGEGKTAELFLIVALSVGDETCNSQNSGHPLFWQVEMSKRLRPAFAVTETAVTITADEKVARTRYESVTGVAFLITPHLTITNAA